MSNQTRTRPIFIFDLDGTVSDDAWRHNLLPKSTEGAPMVECPSGVIADPKALDESYDVYHSNMGDDEPMPAGADILRAAIKGRYGIEFSTARPERFRPLVVAWLHKHFGHFDFCINMRKDGEVASSPVIKQAHIRTVLSRKGYGPAFFFDDREDVCQMAHQNGLFAFVVSHEGVRSIDGNGFEAALACHLDDELRAAFIGAKPSYKTVTGVPFVDSPLPITMEEQPLGIVAATERTETVGNISFKTRIEYAPDEWAPVMPGDTPVAPVADPKRSAADVLQAMADTFRERNKVYGNNAEMVGKVMQVLFPKGVQLTTPEDYHMWHLFELKIVKLTRFAISGLTHEDSIHDDAVYSAMCELLVGTHSINFKGV